MDLVDRYVYAVKRHLPASQQDDIVNELTDDILSQIKDKEEELGRPLNEAEQEAILKQYGHPYLLAMRYRPQQYLIGPALFPFYFPALKIAMGLAFAVQVIVAFSIGLAQNAPERILPRVVAFPGVALQVLFWVTVVFAVADYWQAKLKSLRQVVAANAAARHVAARHPRSSGLIVEVVANIIFLAWWVGGSDVSVPDARPGGGVPALLAVVVAAVSGDVRAGDSCQRSPRSAYSWCAVMDVARRGSARSCVNLSGAVRGLGRA